MNRLEFVSVITLVLLFGLLLGYLTALSYMFGALDLLSAILIVVLIQVLLFFVSPLLMDLLLKQLYKAKQYSVEEFEQIDSGIANIVREISEEFGFRAPTLYLIPDDHPTAFCYGTLRSHARIAISQGILKYLEEDERRAVVAHELGHIVHRDFVVMTVAGIIVQILYLIADACFQAAWNSSSDEESIAKWAVATILGVITYILFWIANLILLWLSRLREYYADDFSARKTSPRSLASALIKVAYGIIRTPGEATIVKRMGALSIMDTKTAKEGLLLQKYIDKHPEVLRRLLAFDLYSPWARLAEFLSTHPLTGKRVARLLKMADVSFDVPAPNFERLYGIFLLDVFVWCSPVLFPVVTALIIQPASLTAFLGALAIGGGIATVLRTLYAYPPSTEEETRVLDLMINPYASPLRGKRVRISGTIVGRGFPGCPFSEDFVVDDQTGLLYIDFKALVPGIGDLFFALSKLKQVLGKHGTFKGWFFRDLSGKLVLAQAEVEGNVIHSHPRAWGLFRGAVLILVGIILYVL